LDELLFGLSAVCDILYVHSDPFLRIVLAGVRKMLWAVIAIGRTHGEDRAVAFELFNLAGKRKRLGSPRRRQACCRPSIQNDGEASRNGEADAPG